MLAQGQIAARADRHVAVDDGRHAELSSDGGFRWELMGQPERGEKGRLQGHRSKPHNMTLALHLQFVLQDPGRDCNDRQCNPRRFRTPTAELPRKDPQRQRDNDYHQGSWNEPRRIGDPTSDGHDADWEEDTEQERKSYPNRPEKPDQLPPREGWMTLIPCADASRIA